MKDRLKGNEPKKPIGYFSYYLRKKEWVECSKADNGKKLAQAADWVLEEWFSELRWDHSEFAQWLRRYGGIAVIKAYIIQKKSTWVVDSLKFNLRKEGYLGLVKAMIRLSMPFSEEQLWDLLYFTNAYLPYQYDIYKLSPTAKYFIAVCKLGSHNYVLAGCDDSRSEADYSRRYVFSAVGKVFNANAPNVSTNCASAIYRVLCSSVPAVFNDEDVLRPKKTKKGSGATVQYRAYELSHEQYVGYTKLLKEMPNPEPFNYYMTYAPPNHQGLITNRYAITSVDVAKRGVPLMQGKQEQEEKKSDSSGEQKDYNSFTNISINNTCRHSALHVLRQFDIRDPQISSFWHARLPNQMEIRLGKIVTPLFIVPIPPELGIKRTSPFLYNVLKKLHNNIIRLSQTNYGIAMARRKVNALGELYKQLHKTQSGPDGNQSAVKAVLNTWKQRRDDGQQSNIALINQPRPRREWMRWSLFYPRKTTSTLLIEEIDKMISRKKARHSR